MAIFFIYAKNTVYEYPKSDGGDFECLFILYRICFSENWVYVTTCKSYPTHKVFASSILYLSPIDTYFSARVKKSKSTRNAQIFMKRSHYKNL